MKETDVLQTRPAMPEKQRTSKKRIHQPPANGGAGFGGLLSHFRSITGVSLRRLAEDAGLKTHTYLSGVERGELLPTPDLVERLAKSLQISADDKERLIRAASDAAHGLTMGYWQPAQRLVERQLADDVFEVWVAVEEMLELYDDDALDTVVRNLRCDRPYVYFVQIAEVWNRLKGRLAAHLQQEQIEELVTCILVPHSLCPYFFCPPFAIIRTRSGYVGTVAFRGPVSRHIDYGTQMDPETQMTLASKLYEIIRLVRQGKSEVEISTQNSFRCIHPEV